MPTRSDEGTPATPRAQGRPRRWPAIAALAATLGLVGAAAVIRAGPGSSNGVRVVAGSNQLVNRGAAGAATRNSPAISQSPTDPRILAITDIAGRVGRPDLSTGVHVSGNGGQTWIDAKLVLPAGQTRTFEAQSAFDGQGTLFVLFSTLEGRGVVTSGLWLESSRDGGQTFSPPVRVVDRLAYQPRLVINQRSGDVHVTWLQASDTVTPEVAASPDQTSSAAATPTTPGPGFGAPPNPIKMATSQDGGATFGEPAQVNDPRRRRVGAASPLLAPNGDVIVLYEDYGTDAADLQGMPGGVHEGTFSLVVSRSTDGGATFSTEEVAESSVVPSERFLAFLPRFPSLAVDPRNGALYVAWSDTRNGDADVFVRRSDDKGKTWSGPVRVDNHKGSPGQQQYLPKVAVAPDGRVDVLFLDSDDQPDKLATTAVLASSVDGANTWSAVAVSDEVFDARLGPRNAQGETGPGTDAAAGTTLGLVSTTDTAYAVWADSRRGKADTQRQDVFFAPVRVGPE